MDENVEKKSTKKVGVVVATIVILLLIAAVVGGVIYLNSNKKPEEIFAKSIEDAFEMPADSKITKEKVELEVSAKIDANNPEISAVNEILKAIKLKATIEADLDKKIFNENILATYNNEQIISLDALIQNEKAYIYLKDLYSKYIEIDEEYLEGIDLAALFGTSMKESDEKLVKDIKQIILDEVKARKLTQEKVKLNDETLLKSTLKLTPKELLEIVVKVLRKVNEYENMEELRTTIEDLEDEIKYMEDTENYAEISIYTKGLTDKFVKAEILLVNVDDEEVISIEANSKSKNEVGIVFAMNENSTSVNELEKLLEVTIKEENENKGTMQIKVNIEEVGAILLNVKYSVDTNPTIEERDTSNSINMNNFGEEDVNEIMTNAQNNEILYSIIQLVSGGMNEEL